MSLRGLLFLAVLVPATVAFSLVSVVGGVVDAPPRVHDWSHRTWSRVLLWAAGVEVRVEGGENLRPGGKVLACNHRSIFDILALLAATEVTVRFVAKEELTRIPFFSGAMRAADHLFIDRGSPRSAIPSMRRFGRKMREEGLSVVVFPEGTRSRDERLGRFKSAPFLLAIEAGAPVVPVAIAGSARVLGKGKAWVRPGRITVRAGREVTTEGLAAGDRTSLAVRVHDRVEGLLEEVRAER